MAALKWVGMCLAASLIAARVDAGGSIFFPEPDFITIPTNDAYPSGITTGPSGDIWFTENGQDRIGRIRPDLPVDEFIIPADVLHSSPTAITAGPDGNMWFIENGTRKISRITPNGTITQFSLPSTINYPIDITSGPDGRLWFTELTPTRGTGTSGAVGNVTVNGTINEMTIDAVTANITRGPDNALWFTTYGLGRITTNGQYRVFPTGSPPDGQLLTSGIIQTDQLPTYDVTTGPDGALWFTYYRPQIFDPEDEPAGIAGVPIDVDFPTIGRMTTDGVLTSFFSPEYPTLQPASITRGPEDNLWFTAADGSVWRINLAGSMAQIVLPTENETAGGLTAGADGRIWFTQPMNSRIGSIESLFFLPVNLAGATPIGLARGADDSIWFADYGGNRIGRIDRNGSLQQHEIGDGHNPTAVAVAPDGSAWFTNPGADTIGHITTDGDFREINITLPPSTPEDIVLGPDGNFWFTEYDAGAIGRITPEQVIERFSIPTPALGALVNPRLDVAVSHPLNITVGPDGNLWFSDCGLNKIGRITTSGEIVEFPIPTADSEPAGITAGADGNLYFVESNAGRVARITTAGVVTELGTADSESFPQYITLGPDGAIWFTEYDANRLGRIGRDGRITHFELPTADSGPTGIVGRGDGRLFVALLNTSQILYTDLAAAEPTHTVTATPSITRTRTATRTATPTLTVPPGSTATSTPSITLTPTLTPTVPPGSTETSTPEPTPTIGTLNCVGDCNGDAEVSINELIAAVNIALGNAPYDSCANADADGDEEIHINDLIAAVNSALQGCPL